jgi:hypothetical protein
MASVSYTIKVFKCMQTQNQNCHTHNKKKENNATALVSIVIKRCKIKCSHYASAQIVVPIDVTKFLINIYFVWQCDTRKRFLWPWNLQLWRTEGKITKRCFTHYDFRLKIWSLGIYFLTRWKLFYWPENYSTCTNVEEAIENLENLIHVG